MEDPEYTFISGAKTDHIYKHEWGNKKGCYFVVMFDEEQRPIEAEIPLRETAYTRIRVRITFNYSDQELSEITLKRYRKIGSGPWRDDPNQILYGEFIRFTPMSFAKLTSLLNVINTLDLGEIDSRRVRLTVDDRPLDDEASKQIRTMLLRDGGEAIISQLLTDGSVSGTDLVNLGYRRNQVTHFKNMIHSKESQNDWALQNGISNASEEGIWQAFFERNKWIFGLGLNYKFNSLLQREASVGQADLSGKGSPRTDFLLSDSRFTVLVEIKTPSAPIFGQARNRAKAWSLHPTLTESVSQVLVQKAELIGSQFNSRTFLDDGEPVLEQTADPKTYLIYGHWPTSAQGEDRDAVTKRRTFELFRQNLRNVDILTFDELLARAEYLVEQTT